MKAWGPRLRQLRSFPGHSPRATGATDRTQPGAGLSLALVHHIASLHEGQLQIESRVGVGSTFILWIPAAANSAILF